MAYRGPVIVDCALYRQGARVAADGDPPALRGRGRPRPATSSGSGCTSPRRTRSPRSREAFGLHPLAVEDAVKAHQRPKLERYDDSLFLVAQDALVRRRRGRRRDRRDRAVRRRRLRRDRAPRRGLGAALGARAPRVLGGRAHPRPGRASSTPCATASSTATRRGRRAGRPTSTRSRRRCSRPSAPTTRPGSTCSKREISEVRRAVLPAARADETASPPARARDRPRSGAVLPRRRRPPRPGRGDRRLAGRPAVDRVRRPPGPDLGAAERRHAQDLGRRRRWSPRRP